MNQLSKLIFAGMCLSMLFVFISCSDEDDTSTLFESCLVEVDGQFIEVELDEKPMYLDGGDDGFSTFLGKEIKYPASARENGVEGRATVSFVISEQGTVNTFEILEDPGEGIGQSVIDALLIVTEGESFSPGKYNGNTVKVKKQIYVDFKLEG